jgi:hypothetical protein
MREIRPSGSEGGGAHALPTPILQRQGDWEWVLYRPASLVPMKQGYFIVNVEGL